MKQAEIRKNGYKALIDSLGVVGMLRFLQQLEMSTGDYTHLVLKLKCLTLGPPPPQNGGLKSISKSPIWGDLGGDWEVKLPSTTFSLTYVHTVAQEGQGWDIIPWIRQLYYTFFPPIALISLE
jgi:hypothetical protein